MAARCARPIWVLDGKGFVLRKALCFLLECLSRRFFAEYGPKVSKGRAESPLVRPQAHNPRHPAGPDAPTPARGQGLQPYGALYASGGGPKGCRGERRETGIQWIQPPKAVSARSFRQTTSGAHGSAGRADCLPRGKPPVCPQAHTLSYWYADSPKGVQGGERKATLHCINGQQLCRKQIPVVGPDAPTPARIGTGRPKGRSHFSFGGERKVCKRKPAARRLQRRPAPLRVAGFVLR